MLKYAALSVLLLVAACALPYSKPGESQSATRSDFSDCQHSTGAFAHEEAASAFGLLGALVSASSGTASQDDQAIDSCMAAKGYAKVD